MKRIEISVVEESGLKSEQKLNIYMRANYTENNDLNLVQEIATLFSSLANIVKNNELFKSKNKTKEEESKSDDS